MSGRDLQLEAVKHESLRAGEPRDMFRPDNLFLAVLPDGTEIYKLTHAEALTLTGQMKATRNGRFITPWWLTYETLTGNVPGAPRVVFRGIEDIVKSSRRAGAAMGAYLRSRGAVKLDWNTVTHMLVVTLTRDATVLIGRCSAQFRSTAHDNVMFIGGEWQLYIDGLEPRDVRVARFGPVGP